MKKYSQQWTIFGPAQIGKITESKFRLEDNYILNNEKAKGYV